MAEEMIRNVQQEWRRLWPEKSRLVMEVARNSKMIPILWQAGSFDARFVHPGHSRKINWKRHSRRSAMGALL